MESLAKCPKHGLHNPFKSPERYLTSHPSFHWLRENDHRSIMSCRYLMYGDISTKAGHMLSLPKVKLSQNRASIFQSADGLHDIEGYFVAFRFLISSLV